MVPELGSVRGSLVPVWTPLASTHHRAAIGREAPSADRLSVTLGPTPAERRIVIAVESAIFTVGAALLAISAHRRVLQRAEGLLLGLAAGALFGVSDVAVKYLTHATGPLYGLLSPWTLTALVAGTIAFLRIGS
jgi:hypothetical protein